MADKKISALTAASTPLAGTEVLPIVQSGSTVKVSISNVTAGRDVVANTYQVNNRLKINATHIADAAAPTGNDAGLAFSNRIYPCDSAGNLTNNTLSLGSSLYQFSSIHTGDNLVIGTAGKGIDFSANPSAPGMTSELLNDYEEGTISIGATCDSGTITLSTNTLYYTKVGRMIHVTGKIVVDSVSSPTGNVYFGLPIVAGVSSAVTLYMSNTNTIASKIPVGVINAGQTIFYVQTLDQVTGNIGGAASIFKAGTEFTFSASYI
jgi:hypothetical protein